MYDWDSITIMSYIYNDVADVANGMGYVLLKEDLNNG